MTTQEISSDIDGKTMCDSGNKDNRPHHVVSAWSKSDGFCLGQTVVHEKSNEITAIPILLKSIAIKGQVITIDAMGTQTAIASQIKEQKGDYVLALKGNQKTRQFQANQRKGTRPDRNTKLIPNKRH